MDVKDRVAIISGAASGLGEATARYLVRSGARGVALIDVKEERGRGLAADLGPQLASFAAADVTSGEALRGAIDQTLETFGKLDIMVSCAGIITAHKILGKDGVHDLEEFRQIVEVNLIGTFNLLRLAARAMVDNPAGEDGERGVIVQTASIAAFEGQIGQAAYAASKAGVVGLTLPAARELAKQGIRVCSIAPGIFDTPMMSGLPDKVRKSLGEQVPFPSRLGSPDEFASLVGEIIRNRMLNGVTIRLDGALRMPAR